MRVDAYYFSWQKRGFDFLTSAILLTLLAPVFAIVAAMILITAGWPVLFTQSRYGQNKKVFKLIKFRTMYVGAEKNQWRYQDANIAPEPMYKNWQDPRFIGVGRWLAKTGLDELPQLINILKGEMSLIGPRPLPVYEAKKLDSSWDFRYLVRPGVFSEWSADLNRHRSAQTWQDLERKTLGQQSNFKYEITIIVKTLVKLLTH